MKTPFPDFDCETARADFSYMVPEFFNFCFDVVDRRDQEKDKLALIANDLYSLATVCKTSYRSK
jgi:hypothetical protein